MFFNKEIEFNQDCIDFLKSDSKIKNTLNIFYEEVSKLNDWNEENISGVINNVKDKSKNNGKLLYMPIRIIISGVMHGPDLIEVIYLIGKEKVLERLEKITTKLKKER